MGDYFDDEDLIGMDMDEGPPPPSYAPPPGTNQTGGGGGDGDPMYDDAFLEEMMVEHGATATAGGGGGGCPTGTTSPSAAAAAVATEAIPATTNAAAAMDDDDFVDGMDTGVGGGPPRVIVTDPLKNVQESSADREKRLYGFERFDGSSEWRTLKSAAGDTMHATGWKKKKNNHKSNAEASDNDSTGSIGDYMESHKRKKITKTVPSRSVSASSSPDAQLVRFLNLVTGGCSDPTSLSSRFSLSRKTSAMPVEGRQSVSVTIGDGSRFYVTQREGAAPTLSELDEAAGIGGCGGSQKGGGLLGVPIADLMRRADALQRKAARRKRRSERRLGGAGGGGGSGNGSGSSIPIADNEDKEEEKKQDNGGGEDSDIGDASATAADNGKNNSMELEEPDNEQKIAGGRSNHQEQEQAQQLWVDKHAPSHFSHLLSDERTNREVLRALREWDPYVFKKAPPPRPTAFSNFRQNGGDKSNDKSRKYGNNNETNNKGEDNEDTESKSKDIRPDEQSRVLLLSGPPGVGKTTLAHIVASHAGYRPLEVNASDERSASVLTERVTRAMESTTLNVSKSNSGVDQIDTMAGRPNCLILDEIDGADAKSAIASLVEIIRADIPAKGTKSKNKKPYLRRPIIFICNHKYAPALRPLLPYSRQFDVTPPSSNRLTARLRSILTAENMSVIGGSTLLHQLVAGTGGDIRSCLYTLQFASARAREMALQKLNKQQGKARVSRGTRGVVDISQSLSMSFGGSGRGMKDERSDVADTISAIFRKVKKTPQADTQGGAAVPRKRDVERILQAVDCFGDNSKALDCLFMNVLRVSYVDPTLDRCLAAHEWMSGADVYRSFSTNVAMTNGNEHFAMQKFHIPSAAAAIHLLCRVETRTDLLLSTRQLNDARYQFEANDGLVSRFVEGLSPKSRCSMHGTGIVSDFIPYCLWILSAGFGSVALNRAVSSMDILNKYEKAAFDHHVGTLRALGLTYVKVDNTSVNVENGGESKRGGMRLEPEIDIISKFEGLTVKHRKEIPSVLKELLAHGANLEEMRERERAAKDDVAAAAFTSSKPQGATVEAASGGISGLSPSKRPTAIKDKTNTGDKSEFSNTKNEPKAKHTPVATSKNFLGIGAAKAKKAKTARKAALVGFDRSKRRKLSHSGSGRPLNEVIKFKYQKGFTQAVRVPCQLEDLL